MTKPKLVLATAPKLYVPVLSELERRAYEAAHLIAGADLTFRESAVLSHRRVLAVDRIVEILVEVFGEGKR